MNGRRGNLRHNTQLTATMTPEMCKAIKRQETNSGLDYWKAGFTNPNNPVSISGIHEKPNNNRHLTQVNFDFPGLFLPNLDTHSLRVKRKPQTKVQPVHLGRSKTSLIPVIKSTRISVMEPSTAEKASKRATVTNLTCLQLADTLMSYNKSPWVGLNSISHLSRYQSTPLRARYTDYFQDSDSESDEVSKSDSHDSSVNKDTSLQTSSYENVAEGGTINSPHVSHTLTNNHDDAFMKPQVKPQKSILKNGPCRSTRPRSETIISLSSPEIEKPSVCTYQLPGAKKHVRSMSETRLPLATYPKIYNDTKDHRGFRQIHVGHESTSAIRTIPINLERESRISGNYDDFSCRKRSVRFNAAHEVREYAPCEPVSFC